jgi:hypothetical protein
MARQPKPDFERYMTALHCDEPDRAPLGDWHVEMKNTIVALEEAGLRNSVKIIVGGAPVTKAFADEIGADGIVMIRRVLLKSVKNWFQDKS